MSATSDSHSKTAKDLQNFHYSGSFGIPDSSIASPYCDLSAQLENEVIAIEAGQLYEGKKMSVPIKAK